jgi:hypothetical protein
MVLAVLAGMALVGLVVKHQIEFQEAVVGEVLVVHLLQTSKGEPVVAVFLLAVMEILLTVTVLVAVALQAEDNKHRRQTWEAMAGQVFLQAAMLGIS